MIIYIDIDETICHSPNKNYRSAVPIRENIRKANKLYDQGHTIIYWTARGSGSGTDWTEVTKRQILEWGAKCHEVRLGKPSYDLFIDDKALNVLDWK